MPSVRSSGSPSKAKKTRIPQATQEARTAIARLCAWVVPLVSEAKIGAQPGGSMITSKAMKAVVIGRSKLVGKPVAQLLLAENATVTQCHSRTRDLAAVCRRADVLVAAVGSPRMIGAEVVKPGATVIDVGTNRTEDGLVGDVDFEAVKETAGAITPVPGGVGPMTIAMLLSNTLRAANARLG